MQNHGSRFQGGFVRLLAVSAAFIGSASAAQQNASSSDAEDSDRVVQLDPFTVEESTESSWKSQLTFSVSRVAENTMNVPVNISILTDDFMRDIGAVSLQDVLMYGGSGVNQRVSYRDDISIRGF